MDACYIWRVCIATHVHIWLFIYILSAVRKILRTGLKKDMVVLAISRKLAHINKIKPWIHHSEMVVSEAALDAHASGVVNSCQGKIATEFYSDMLWHWSN